MFERLRGRVTRRRVWIGVLILLMGWIAVGMFNTVRRLPPGTSVLGSYHAVSDVEFLYDLTFVRDGEQVVEQQIFDRVLRMIDDAERFVLVDMFLFNNEHGGDREYIPLTNQLTDRLVAKRAQTPDVDVTFTTDEINTFYGAYRPEHFARLEEAGVDLVITDLTKLRDSNPAYAAVWRVFLQWFGTRGPGFFPHPLTSRGQLVTARSYLRLLNMKANHRKVIVTDKECLIASANPHDASSFHSNIAWVVRGPVCGDVVDSERKVAEFSGTALPALTVAATGEEASMDVRVRFLTEGRIRERILTTLGSLQSGDSVDVAMFYLSDRGVVRGFRKAARDGAVVRLILDPNKDAFGRQKGGIPNRQVAHELHGNDGTEVRWFDTHGEQFHTKLVIVKRQGEYTMFGGSANLTRRNLQDFNLEADLEVVAQRGHPITHRVTEYFDQIWNNDGGEYTVEYEAYRDPSWLKTAIYRVQEFTGLCSY